MQDPTVRAFEDATIKDFHHLEHLYVAWCYLRALSPEDALARYARHLRKLAEANGAPQNFHATITWASMALVGEAMARSPGLAFASLLEAHPELLARNALEAYYAPGELAGEARQRFVLPRRGR